MHRHSPDKKEKSDVNWYWRNKEKSSLMRILINLTLIVFHSKQVTVLKIYIVYIHILLIAESRRNIPENNCCTQS